MSSRHHIISAEISWQKHAICRTVCYDPFAAFAKKSLNGKIWKTRRFAKNINLGSACWILTNSSDLPFLSGWNCLRTALVDHGSPLKNKKKWCCCQNSVGRLHSKNTFNGKLTNPLGQVGLAQGQFFVGSSNFEMLNKEGGSGSTAPRLPESFVHRVGWIVSENILVTLNLERRFRSCLLLIPIDMDKYLQFYQSCRAKNIPAVFSYIELMLKFKLQFPIPQALQHWNSWCNPRLASHLL